MDYSLLLGIESRVKVLNEEGSRTVQKKKSSLKRMSTTSIELERFKRHRLYSPDGAWSYHVSIIDFLQLWNFGKKFEQFGKSRILKKCAIKDLSSVEPVFYRDRF